MPEPLQFQDGSHCIGDLRHSVSRHPARARKLLVWCGREAGGIERTDLKAEENSVEWKPRLRRCYTYVDRIVTWHVLRIGAHHNSNHQWLTIDRVGGNDENGPASRLFASLCRIE